MPLTVAVTGWSPLGAGPAPEVAVAAAARSAERPVAAVPGSGLPRLAMEIARTSRVTTTRTVSRVRSGRA